MKNIISHLKQSKDKTEEWNIQTNEEHSNGVAQLASEFSSEFGFGDVGKILGLLHDKGKEKIDFQNYICKTSGYKTDLPSWQDKSHAYVGAVLAKIVYGPLGDLMANQIAGHHAGLYDTDELNNDILKKDIPKEIDTNISKIQIPTDVLRTYNRPEELHHLIRILYSCLVDADFLDTERFMNPESFASRKNSTTMKELKEMLQAKLDEFKNAPDTDVNRIRRRVQDKCLEASTQPQGFFSLTVPTGGGKTISSIIWAINHAIKNSKKRIIIAIPYTSIIVQTAAVLKSIFGENNVLEHHSNIDFEQCKDAQLRHQMKLATENWDYPIIVTTNVQLFESMFSNKPSVCRKLHNLSNSVLILDEVQTLPTDFLQPIVDALKCYQKHFGMSVLFTTASQPILSGNIQNQCGVHFKGIENNTICEIIPRELDLSKKLKRVDLTFDQEISDYDEIARRMSKNNVVLCIVNTRKDACEIYHRLPKEGITLHLSRMMYPQHVSASIAILKTALSNKYPVIRVVATQLIEAGVDIDFPIVFRQISGLDSILQAAGRCNREGKLSIGHSFVFKLPEQTEKGMIGKSINAMKELLIEGNMDYFAEESMYSYFKTLYSNCSFDKKELYKEIAIPNRCGIPKNNFQKIADKFQLIDNNGYVAVIIKNEHSKSLVDQLTSGNITYLLMKKLMQYSVNVSKYVIDNLEKENIVYKVNGQYVADGNQYYSPDIGLLSENHYLEETLMV